MRAPVGLFALSVFIGSLLGAMANVMPFQVVLLSAAVLMIAAWVEEDDSLVSFLIVGSALLGGIFGSMSSVIPWGFSLLMGIVLFIKVWKRPNVSSRVGGVSNMVLLPFLILIGVGLFYNFTYSDFCINASGFDVCSDPGNWVNGFPTIWTSCQATCGITPFSLLGSSIFSTFVLQGTSADYVSVLLNLFNPSTQTGISFILSALGLGLGVLLVLLSLGIGFSGTFLASGIGVTVNEAGTRLAQSYGIGLILWSVTFLGFGYWLLNSFGGLFGTAIASSTLILLTTVEFYGLYVQGKTISA